MKWINCKQKLPSNYTKVIVAINEEYVTIEVGEKTTMNNAGGECKLVNSVKEWIHLPKPYNE